MIVLSEIPSDKSNQQIQYVCKLRSYIVQNNYYRVFLFLQQANELASLVMNSNYFKNKLRDNAIRAMLSAFNPQFSIASASSLLGFKDIGECREYLLASRLVLVGDYVMTKESKKTFTANKKI
jgi:hypothetical protein